MIRNFISKLYSLYTPSFFMSGGGSAGGYVIERSLRFMAASSNYLTRTFNTPTNNTTWTLSRWLKRGSLGAIQGLFTAGSSGIFFNASAQLILVSNAGTTLATSTRVFRDTSAFGHLHVKSNGTMIEAYWNNELALSYTGTITNLNSAIVHNSGRNAGGTNQYFDGYMSEINFIDGQALPPSSFGETIPTTGQWVAKKYTGTYGTNGFYLDFKDGSSTTTLGQDKSGNGNNWTLTNFTRSAGVNDCWMLDVPAGNGSASAVQPSGNYAVLNPLNRGTVTGSTWSSGSLNYTSGSSNNWGTSTGSISMSSGKWYWECTPQNALEVMFGLTADTLVPLNITPAGWNTTSWAYYSTTGNKYNNTSPTAYGASYTANDVIGVAFDADAGTLIFYKNGVSQGVAFSGIPAGSYTAHVGTTTISGTNVVSVNFGQRSFAYTPPTGFKALCTSNLPTPSIKKPSDHFNVQLSTGANIKTDSEALFTNELVWIKDRANANNHQLIDSVRGSNAVLQSNTTSAETTYTAPSGSSVGWVWRASDSSAVTNNSGSISSQVSANVAAGFSIVAYTGTGVGATIGHGMGIAPSMVIVKSRGVGGVDYQWIIQHKNVPATQLLLLNATNAAFTSSGFNNTYATSTVFSTNGLTGSGGNLHTYVAYCFAEIAGYSKFGSYTGNGSADGPFVYLGFKPRFVMIKRTDTTSNWTILDSSRAGYNVDNDPLYPNLTNAEATTDLVDLISNGFKLRSTDASINANGGTYIYMAFAETPFQYANAR